MNRGELVSLSKVRIREARILLRNKCYDGAYYLAGYSIECGIKACIAKNTQLYDFPDKDLANKSYSHNLAELVKVAGIEIDRKNRESQDPDFAVNWSIVKGWKETSRYGLTTQADAEELFLSIISKKGGILRWVQQHW